MIALWIYLGGAAAAASLIVFEQFDSGVTAWTWYAPLLWPLMLPAVAVCWAMDRLTIRRPWWLR